MHSASPCSLLKTPPSPSHKQQGLTLIELLVTISILAVLMGIALPSFTPLIQRWQANQAAAELESTLMFARTESVRRGGGLSLVRTPSNESCVAKDNEWQCGWTLVIDNNLDGVADAFDTSKGEASTVLRQSPPSSNHLILAASAAGSAILIDRWGSLSLRSEGSAGGTNFSITVRPSKQPTAEAAKLCVRPGGHLQKIKASADC